MGAGDRDIPGRHHRGRPTPPGHGQRVVGAERRTQTIETQKHRRHHHPATTITFTHSTPRHLCQPSGTASQLSSRAKVPSSFTCVISSATTVVRRPQFFAINSIPFSRLIRLRIPPSLHQTTVPAPANVHLELQPTIPASGCSNCGGNHGPQGFCRAKGLTFYNCGKRGHLQSVCRAARGQAYPARDALPPAHTRRTGFTVAPTKSI